MPFKSKAQRRKFAELLVKGEISPETFEEWNRETGSAKLPERLTPRVAENLLAQGNCLALEFATQAAEVAQYVDRRLRLGPGLGAERIPGLERDHAGKLLDPRLKCVGDAKEEPPALPRNRA